MSRFAVILLTLCAISCTPTRHFIPYPKLHELSEAFGKVGQEAGTWGGCSSNRPENFWIEGEKPRRWQLDDECRVMWMDSDKVIRAVVMSKWHDTLRTLDTWTFGAIVQTEENCTIHRLDTIFARDEVIDTIIDSIPAYLEQAYRWTLSKNREDLPLVCDPRGSVSQASP